MKLTIALNNFLLAPLNELGVGGAGGAGPGPMDIRRRTSYQLRDKKHNAAVLSAYHKTNGYSNFLGIWHTHPEPHPTPSNIDLSDWKKRMLENHTLIPAFIFAIIGTQTTSYFIYKNKRFTYEK